MNRNQAYLGDVEPLIPCLQSWIDASQKHQILHKERKKNECLNHNQLLLVLLLAKLATHHLVLSPHLLYQRLQSQEEGGRVSILIMLDDKLLKIFVKSD